MINPLVSTLIKGMLYLILKAKQGGKYLSRKQVIDKRTGRKTWKYKYKPMQQRAAHEVTRNKFEKVTKLSGDEHKSQIEHALQNGVRVSLHVLKDYPDLITKYNQQARMAKAEKIRAKVKAHIAEIKNVPKVDDNISMTDPNALSNAMMGNDNAEKDTIAEPTNNFFKINSEGKMELHFDKQKYKNLSDDQKREIKRSFLFSPSRGAWVSRSKHSQYGNKELAQKLGLEEAGKEKKLTFQEEIELKKQRAENRADKYEYKSEKAVKNAEALQSAFNRLRKDWSWLTQPIIDTAGGRAFGRSRQRVINQYSKGFEEYDKARYYDTRAQIAKDTASDANLKRPLYLQNRIKDAEKSIRAINKWVSEYETEMNNPSTDETRKEKIVTWLEDGLEKLKYNYDKLAYYQVALENLKQSSGETVYTKDVMKEMGKNIKTHFKELGLKDVKVNSSNKYMSVSMRPELPKDLRYEVGKFLYPNDSNDPNNPRNIGNIMPTYITMSPKDWDNFFKTKGKDIVNGDTQPAPDNREVENNFDTMPESKPEPAKNPDLKANFEAWKEERKAAASEPEVKAPVSPKETDTNKIMTSLDKHIQKEYLAKNPNFKPTSSKSLGQYTKDVFREEPSWLRYGRYDSTKEKEKAIEKQYNKNIIDEYYYGFGSDEQFANANAALFETIDLNKAKLNRYYGDKHLLTKDQFAKILDATDPKNKEHYLQEWTDSIKNSSNGETPSGKKIPKHVLESVNPPKPQAFKLEQEDITSKEKNTRYMDAQGGLFGKKPTTHESYAKKDLKPALKLEGNETITSLVTAVKSALMSEGLDIRAREFVDKAFKEKDLASLKKLASEYVKI